MARATRFLAAASEQPSASAILRDRELLVCAEAQHLLVVGSQPLEGAHHLFVLLAPHELHLRARVWVGRLHRDSVGEPNGSAAGAGVVVNDIAGDAVQPGERGIACRNLVESAPYDEEHVGHGVAGVGGRKPPQAVAGDGVVVTVVHRPEGLLIDWDRREWSPASSI